MNITMILELQNSQKSKHRIEWQSK